ncbi:MAG: sugar transferase, partial [Chloroflexi bacterium]|nr:sugar transferase [Chloroflexota bacterium]
MATQQGLHTERLRDIQGIKYRRGYYFYAKRVFDVSVCLLILPLVLVLMAAIAFALWFETRQSPFFTQVRVGLGGRPFKIYKFCTLSQSFDQEAHRAFMKGYIRGEIPSLENASQLKSYKPPFRNATRLGRFLRRVSLDELPQIFNILLGDMSLIGPRPNVTWEVE